MILQFLIEATLQSKMRHIIKNIIRNLVFAGVMAGVGLMVLSLKVRNFEYKSLLIFYQDAEQENVEDNWVEYFLMELADTGEELPNKHLSLKTVSIQIVKVAAYFTTYSISSILGGCITAAIYSINYPTTKAFCLPEAGYISHLHLFKLF